MRKIQLTRGFYTYVDDEDFEVLSQWKWYAQIPDRWKVNAARRGRVAGKLTTITMHRQILDAPRGILVDHRDGNGSNNGRLNLRLCDHAGNARNSRSRVSKTGFRGVTFLKGRTSPWRASLKVNGRIRYVGCCRSDEEAARAYDVAAIDLHGEFASLNFPNANQTSRSDGVKR